jgi:hypothetical protein
MALQDTANTFINSATSAVSTAAGSLVNMIANASPLAMDNMSGTVDMPGLSRKSSIPEVIFNNYLSTTSQAADCFVNQRFSAKLQGYLVGYVAGLTTGRSIYGG